MGCHHEALKNSFKARVGREGMSKHSADLGSMRTLAQKGVRRALSVEANLPPGAGLKSACLELFFLCLKDSWECCSGMPLLVMYCHLFLVHLQYVALTIVNSLGFFNYYSLCVGTVHVSDIHIALVRIAENSTREKMYP